MSARKTVNQEKELPKRKSIRLKAWDYSTPWWYYVTICTQDMKQRFGRVVGADPSVRPYMELNNAGKMIDVWWSKIPGKFGSVELDIYQIMPNHLHGVIILGGGSTHGSTPTKKDPTIKGVGADPCVRPKTKLGDIVQWFKTMSTNEYIRNVKNNNWSPFKNRLWQRNYHEHIIRNERDLQRIREYIQTNPDNWHDDEYHPENIK